MLITNNRIHLVLLLTQTLYFKYSIIISIQIVLICTEKWNIDLEYPPGRQFMCSLVQLISFLTAKRLQMIYSSFSAESWTRRKVDQKHLKSLAMWCWRRTENIIWTVRVRNGEVLHRVKEERDMLHKMKRRKAICVGHILCRNWLLKHVTEGKLEGKLVVTGRRGRGLSSYWMTLKKREDTVNLK